MKNSILVGTILFLLIASGVDAAEVNYYVYNNLNRNVTEIVDSSGAVTNEYNYDSFGNVKKQTENKSNVYKYNGEQNEQEATLIYLRKRYYDSIDGRFITRDSFAGIKMDPQSLNPYTYSFDNPLNLKDATGNTPVILIPGIIGGIAGIGGVAIGDIMRGELSPWQRYVGGAMGGATSAYALLFTKNPWASGGAGAFTSNFVEQGLYFLEDHSYSWDSVSMVWDTFFGAISNGIAFKGMPRGPGREAASLRSAFFGKLGQKSSARSFFEAIISSALRSISGKKDRDRDNSYIGGPPGGGGGGSRLPGYYDGGSYYSNYNPYFSGSYGGVSLSKTADLMLNIQDIDGATYDEATGQVILYGRQNTSLPNMNLDDLAVAIRSVYGVDKPAQDPGVSIDFTVPYTETQIVNYFGDTNNTNFGWVMFESDRLLKCLGIGTDNITGEVLSSSVPGYENVLERFKDAGGSSLSLGEFNGRVWFVPKEVKLIQSADASSMVFDTATMQVLTESKFKDNIIGNPCLEAYAAHFTDNYDAFAEERPIFKELKRLAKITAVVKWIKDNNIPFDLSFFENFTPQFYATSQTTPVAHNSISWTEGNILYNPSLYGGVTYKLDASNFSTSTDPLADADKQQAVDARLGDSNFMWEFNAQDTTGQTQPYTAIAQSLSRAKKDGNVNMVEVDISFPAAGDNPLSFVRYYDSFDDKATGFGQGWQITPYSLRFSDTPTTFTFGSGALSVSAHYQIFVREGTAEYLYTLSGLDANGLPVYMWEAGLDANGLPIWESGSDLLKDEMDGTFRLYRRNNETAVFDSNGQVTRITDRNGVAMVYSYGGTNLINIQGAGRGFSLNYDGNKITNVVGDWGKTVTYTYYPNGQLKTATDPEGQTTTYYYDADNRLIEIDDPRGNRSYQATYDDYNRASTETVGSSQYSNQYSLSDRETITTDPNGTQTTTFFDTDYKLLQSEDFLNNKVNFTYAVQSFGPDSVTDPEGKVTQYKYDSQGNVCYVKDPQGYESFFFYDSNNNMVASRDELGHDITYSYDDSNRIIEIHHVASIDYDPASGPPQNSGAYNQTYDPAYVTHFTYDASNGNMLSATDTEGRAVNMVYNAYGLPLTVTTPNGYQVATTYDNFSRATSITDQGGENVSFGYDNVDRIKTITTAAGSINYTYDKNGNVNTIYDGKNNPTGFGYDNNNNLVTVTDAEGGVTSYEYDVMGNITKITMPNGSTKEITYDEAGRPISEINRRANPAPQMVVLISSLDFGSISSGTSVEKDIVVYNVGDANLIITGVSADNGVFTVSPASATVLPHGQVTIAATYMAPAVGSSSGNLTIHCNDSATPTVTISLSGSAIQQSLNTNVTSTLNGMLVTWDKYAGTGSFDHYGVYRSDSVITDISGLTPLQTITNINQTSYLDSTTTLQNQYYYSVVAFDAASNNLTPIASTKPVTYLNLGKIGSAINIASSSHNEQNVSVIYNNTSREYLLVYEYDISGTGSNYDIYGQRLADDGTKIGSAFPIFNSGYTERNAQVAWNSSRNEYMAVCEYDTSGTGTYKIRMQRFSATGSLLGSSIDNPIPTYGVQCNPSIAYDSVDNRYAIAFDGDYSNVGREQLIFLIFDADGNFFSGIMEGQPNTNFKHCKIAYNPAQNNYLTVFEYVGRANTYVVGLRFDSTASVLDSGYLTIGIFMNNDTQPNVLYDSTRGEYVVIWQFDNYYGTPGVYQTVIRKVSTGGVPGTYQIYATNNSMLWPNLALSTSRSEYLMTVTSLNIATNEYDIFSQRISSVDLSLLTNSAINVADENSVIERKASSVFDHNSNEFLIAYERQSGSNYGIRAQRIGELSTLLDIEPASLDFSTELTQQTVQISNTSGQNYMTFHAYSDAAWLSGSPAYVNIVNSVNPTATITITADRTGLSAGSYSGNISIDCEGISTEIPVTMQVTSLPPNSPTNPTPVTGTTGQAVLGTPLRVAFTWQCTDPQGGVLNYDIYLSDNQSLVTNADPSVLKAQSQNVASYISPALGYNKTYYWRVKSRNSSSLTALGGVWNFTTIPIAAPVLIPPTINPVNTGKPIFQWNAVDGATLYNVQIANNPDFNSPIVNVANISTTEYTPATDLPEGTMYWRVAAIDAQGDVGAFSSSTSSNAIIIDVTPPPPVTLIAYSPDPTNNQKPTLTWNASVGASLYHVQIASTSDFLAPIFNGYVSETTYTPVSNLPEGKTWWRVSAKDLAGNESQYSSPSSFTIDITPPGVVHITSAKGGLGNIKIIWDTFNDVGGDFHNFNIYRAESVITNVSGMTSLSQSITDKTVTSFIDTTAISGKTYYYAVTATDTAGNEYKQVTSFGPATVDRAPTLDWTGDTGYESGGLSPLSGSGTTVFTFKIKYTDLDGDIPTIHKVYIDMNGDGNYSAFDMTTTGTDYTSGVIYTYTTSIPYSQTSQSHSYYFGFSDGLQSATANITQGLSQATAIHKPDVFQTLSLTIDHAVWQLLNIVAGSEQLTNASNKIRVTNNGDGSQTYSLSITDQGGWTASADKNGADVNTFVLSVIFAGDTDAGIDSTYFNEIGNDDVVLTSSTDRASSTRFGSTRLSQNGVSVPVGSVRSLWLDLKAPTKDTTTKGATHSVGVTINAEAS